MKPLKSREERLEQGRRMRALERNHLMSLGRGKTFRRRIPAADDQSRRAPDLREEDAERRLGLDHRQYD